MKHLIFVVTLAMIISFDTGCEESRAQMMPDQPKNPEAEKLGKAIFTAISTDNYAVFTDLLVMQHDYVVMMRASTDPETQEKANDSTNGMQDVHRDARRSFDGVRKDGLRQGIAWERTKYKYSAFLLDTVNGVEEVTLKVAFTFRDLEYAITATEVVKTPQGWRMMGRVAFGDHLHYKEQRAQMEVQMELIVEALIDSLRKADSMVEVQMRITADSAYKADSVAKSIISEAERKRLEEEENGKKKKRKKK